MPKRTNAVIIGTGGFSRCHIGAMLKQTRTTKIVGLVEVSEASRHATREFFEKHEAVCPPFYGSLREFLKAQGPANASLICTPHKFHFENCRDSLLAGMDVLVEKPMVMNASEARRLIALRDRTRRLVVVGFPGSLSPAVKKAKELIKQGAIGRVTAVAGWVHQQWKRGTTGTWRQNPALSGGGFLFDTGSHMVNTIVDIVGEDIVEVSAVLDNCGTPVEINAAVGARSRSGVMISICAAGNSIQCVSDIMVCGEEGVIQTGIWGERLNLKTLKQPAFEPVKLEPSEGVWGQFVKVRNGRMKNPCPPEVGLRFAKLMDMVYASAKAGKTVRV
jgi:predicted dehydrogenase